MKPQRLYSQPGSSGSVQPLGSTACCLWQRGDYRLQRTLASCFSALQDPVEAKGWGAAHSAVRLGRVPCSLAVVELLRAPPRGPYWVEDLDGRWVLRD